MVGVRATLEIVELGRPLQVPRLTSFMLNRFYNVCHRIV
jgi:hypothetical protein